MKGGSGAWRRGVPLGFSERDFLGPGIFRGVRKFLGLGVLLEVSLVLF